MVGMASESLDLSLHLAAYPVPAKILSAWWRFGKTNGSRKRGNYDETELLHQTE